MASTYSDNLRLELIGTGDQAGEWGDTTNRNLGTLLESSISGAVTVTTTTANQALTIANGSADQARNMVLKLNTTSGGAYNVYAPPYPKVYIVRNLSGTYAAQLFNSTVSGNTTAAGTGVTIPANKSLVVFSDGTDMLSTGVTTNANLTGVVTSVGNATSFGSSTGSGAVVLATNPTLTPTLASYTETVFAVSGTTPVLSPVNGTIQTWTLSNNSTPTAGGTWAAGQSLTLMIDDGTSYAITWTSMGVVWKTNAGAAPLLNTSGVTAIQLWKVGTTIYGARVGDA